MIIRIKENNMSERHYHGHTLKEISDTYYISYQGNEDAIEVYEINSKLTKYWQSVSYYYTDSKRKLADAKNELRRMQAQSDLEISEAKGRLLDENKLLPKADRLSDKARETLAIRECMDSETQSRLQDLRDEIAMWEEECAIWHEVRQNFRFISDRINNSTMNMGIEAKINKGFSIDPSKHDGPVRNIASSVPVIPEENDVPDVPEDPKSPSPF